MAINLKLKQKVNRFGKTFSMAAALLFASSISLANQTLPPRNFVAAEYFEPKNPSTLSSTLRRPPGKIVLSSPLPMEPVEAQSLLLGLWRFQFTCDFEPLSWSRARGTSLFTGVGQSPAIGFIFYPNANFERVDLGTYFRNPIPQAIYDFSSFAEVQGTYSLVQASDSKFTLVDSAFAPATLTFHQIRETGELIVVSESPDLVPFSEAACGTQKTLRAIMTRIPSV